jgi:hypothetical protein
MRIIACCLLAACATDPTTTPTPSPGKPDPTPSTGVAACPDPAGKLTIYAIPPPVALDWSTPNALLGSVIASRSAASDAISAGDAVIGHSIGHVNLQLDCGDLSIALTGQTDQGGGDWQAASDGAGLLLRDTAGAMDDMAGIGDRDQTIADIAAREQSGRVTRISFTVNRAMCERVKNFVDAYVASGAYQHYGGAHRARRMEGAGCANFGAGVIDVGGLLRRSLVTPEWARTEMIGSARIANFLGWGGYAYGGDLVARDDAGTHWLWPKGQEVPASNIDPVLIYSSVLDAWSGPEDHDFGVPGATGEMATKLPFTIYDPELMAEWAEGVWSEAMDSPDGTASALGATWTAGRVVNAHEITYDARCVMPQSIDYAADDDDLFADSAGASTASPSAAVLAPSVSQAPHAKNMFATASSSQK